MNGVEKNSKRSVHWWKRGGDKDGGGGSGAVEKDDDDDAITTSDTALDGGPLSGGNGTFNEESR